MSGGDDAAAPKIHVASCPTSNTPRPFRIRNVAARVDFNEGRGSHLACALIAHHATSLADTLASELGILSKSRPILIVSGRRVPPGTNGGVTLAGTGCSALGGLVIGLG